MAASSSSFFLLLLLISSLSISADASLSFAEDLPESPAISAALLAPVLSNLGFQELAMAVLSISTTAPVTIFAPSDDSIRSCSAAASAGCSPARLLSEHLVPGLFPLPRLSQLPFGTKLQTAAPNRCLTVTSTAGGSKIFVEGVEITGHDLYDDGNVVIHGLRGFIAPLSPYSCYPGVFSGGGSDAPTAMLRDAILHLRDHGFSILSLAMRIYSPELLRLEKMTVFALDDISIFGGGGAYMLGVRFHIVPNQLLLHSDLEKLPVGTVLLTLVKGQHLVVTQNAFPRGAPFPSRLRINYVPIKAPDVVFNGRIAVHALVFPFPHLYLADIKLPESEIDFDDVEGSPPPSSCNYTAGPAPVPAPLTVPAPAPVPSGGAACGGSSGSSGKLCRSAPRAASFDASMSAAVWVFFCLLILFFVVEY